MVPSASAIQPPPEDASDRPLSNNTDDRDRERRCVAAAAGVARAAVAGVATTGVAAPNAAARLGGPVDVRRVVPAAAGKAGDPPRDNDDDGNGDAPGAAVDVATAGIPVPPSSTGKLKRSPRRRRPPHVHSGVADSGGATATGRTGATQGESAGWWPPTPPPTRPAL